MLITYQPDRSLCGTWIAYACIAAGHCTRIRLYVVQITPSSYVVMATFYATKNITRIEDTMREVRLMRPMIRVDKTQQRNLRAFIYDKALRIDFTSYDQMVRAMSHLALPDQIVWGRDL